MKTDRGDVAIGDLTPSDKLLTASKGWLNWNLMNAEVYDGLVVDIGCGWATWKHPILVDGKWIPAHEYSSIYKHYEGYVLCPQIETDESEEDCWSPDTARSFTLANGLKVHNFSI